MSTDLSQQAILLSHSMDQQLGNGWFPPGVPLKPMAPADFGWLRTHDYDIATNITITPKATDKGLTYRQLRNLAESNDYAAIAIQTVLDRLCATEGRVVDADGDPRKPSKKAEQINAWTERMDGVTPRSEFLQAAGYDMCVIDAPCAAVDKTDPLNPIVYNMDGATVVAHLNERGRVASFGQVIKGQIAHEYDVDEIVWMPKNRRPHKIYGYSPLEQVQNVVSISLRRMARQMDWFTQGNMPDALLVAPKDWTPQQIKDINQNWEKQLAGVSGKNKGRWVPPGTTVEQLDRNPVSGEFDEWLIRVIFSAYSLPPTPFVKQVNRSTSESMQDASTQEGHAAVLRWAANFLTAIITSAWGQGYKWIWNLAQPTKDETIKLLTAGVLKPSAAMRLGFLAEEIADALPNAQAAAPKDDAAKPDGLDPKEEVKPSKVANADATDDAAFADHIQTYLDKLQESAESTADGLFHGKAPVLDVSAPAGWRAKVQVMLGDAALEGAKQAVTLTAKKPSTFASVKTPALDYVRERSAEMVGMKVVNGKLVPNPDAKWQVSDMARKSVSDNVSQAFEEHWTPSELSQRIADDKAFGPIRANNIARTEIATAQEVGSLSYFKAAGVTGKRWSDADGCPICKANAAQGIIPIDQDFQSGHQHAPAHPACRCRIIPEELPA